MPYQLVVIKGRSANQVLKLPSDGVTTVGRQQGCQIRIGSSQVSRKHCELFEKHGHLLVKDLNSSNGTIVNGKKVEGQQVLEPGNILLIGSVAFRVEPASAPAAVPVSAPGGGPGDTAVAQPATVGGDADIDLDFEETDDSLTALPPASQPAATAPEPQAEAETAPESDEPVQEIGEDAVAEYLLNIDLDDEDKL